MRGFVYLASAYCRREELVGYAKELVADGWGVVSVWLTGALETHGPDVGDYPKEELATIAQVDLSGIGAADVFVMFTDQERDKGGKDVEFGYALAKGVPVFLVGPVINVFHHLPQVKHASDFGLLRLMLGAWGL